MYPYIKIGPIILWTYGLTGGVAFLCAWKLLEINLRRHDLPQRFAQPIILLLVVSGIAGAKLYAVLEAPGQLLADPVSMIFSLNGYTWLGGFLAGVTALWFVAGRFSISSLALLDLASPCAAFSYGIARLGCLLAGDGDYGTVTSLPWGMSFPHGMVPTVEHVHPTPIYECLAGVLIFCYLWRIGGRDVRHGSIAARYLILTGVARFLVEFIRRNPPVIPGLSDAQIISLLCVAAGLRLLARTSREFESKTLLSQITYRLFTNGDHRNLRPAPKANGDN